MRGPMNTYSELDNNNAFVIFIHMYVRVPTHFLVDKTAIHNFNYNTINILHVVK